MEVCPTDVVHAPAERVWQLLMDPRELTRWSGTKLFSGPARPLETGDVVVIGGFGMRMSMEVLDAEAPNSARAYIRLPFGIVNHEHVQITPLGSNSCRVTLS